MNKNQAWNMEKFLRVQLLRQRFPGQDIDNPYRIERGILTLQRLGWIEKIGPRDYAVTKLGIVACQEAGIYDQCKLGAARAVYHRARFKALKELETYTRETLTTAFGSEDFDLHLHEFYPAAWHVRPFKWDIGEDRKLVKNLQLVWQGIEYGESSYGIQFPYDERVTSATDIEKINHDLPILMSVLRFLNEQDAELPQLEEFMEFDYAE